LERVFDAQRCLLGQFVGEFRRAVVDGVLGALVAPATMALVTDLADESERGIAMAGFNLAGSLGFLGGFLLGGTVASSYGYGLAFLVVGGLEIAIAVVTVPVFLRLSLEPTDRVRSGDRGDA
ncbi:MFS transporter, partial [Natrinema soli]